MRYFPSKFSKENLILLNIVKEVLENLRDLLPLTIRQVFY